MNQTASASKQPSAPREIARIQQVIGTVRALSEIMSRETDLLRALRVRDFSAIQKQKLALIDTYEKQTRELSQEPGFAKSLDARLREELKDIVERMQEIMHENAQAIQAARELNQRVATAIVDAVQSGDPQSELYAKDGGLQKNKDRKPPVSVQIDGRY